MSNDARSAAAASAAAVAVAAASKKDSPTAKQLLCTLRFCLRYNSSSANIFTRIMSELENINFMPFLLFLTEDELRRLMTMIAERLTRIRLKECEIPMLFRHCQQSGIKKLPLIRTCELLPSNSNVKKSNFNHLRLLGELLPALELLHMHYAISEHIPKNLKNLRTLLLHQSTKQLVLDEICENCPQIQQLYLRNETAPHDVLDIKSIVKCRTLREVQLPLLLKSPLALCSLPNLVHLSLQRLQPWPVMTWLSTVKNIISYKRYELRSLIFDGNWLTTPLDLSQFQLDYCWALQELQVSNCKLADQNPQPTLPLSCQRLSLKGCTLRRLLHYLRGNSQLLLLDLFDCKLINNDGQLLLHLLKQRQSLPTVSPLTLRFWQSTPLHAELISLNKTKRQYWEEWLQVRELHESEVVWKQPIGTISMTFGPSITYMPDLQKLNLQKEPTPAELIRSLGVAN